MRIPLTVFFLSLLGCKTGSNFEALKLKKGDEVPAANAEPSTATFFIRPLTFAKAPHRSEMYRKAFVVPGFKGIDFDGYGRLDADDEKSGMRTIYSTPAVDRVLSDALVKLELKSSAAPDTAPEDATAVGLEVLDSETSMRMHTYGCWLFVGVFVYLVNGDVYTVVNHTRLAYTLSSAGKPARNGVMEIHSEKNFGFWTTYMGFEILESFQEAQTAHFADIAAQLASLLRKAG